jgi:O-antigen ligase
MFNLKELLTNRMMMVSTLVFLFPLCINTLRHWASSTYILIFLISLTVIWKNHHDLRKEEKIFLGILLLHVLVVFTSNMLAGWTYASNRWFFAGEFRILAAIPVYLYLRQIPGIWKWLLHGIPLGGIIIGLTGIIDFGMQYYRGEVAMIFAEGAYGHIFQGNIAALLSIMSFLAIEYFKEDERMRRLCIAGASLAFVGAIVSVARNGWLSLIILYFVAFISRGGVIAYLGSIKPWKYVAGIVLIIPTLYFLSTIDFVKARFERVAAEPVAYFNADRSQKLPYTSIGFRFEQWRGVLIAFQEKPILGHGVGNMGKVTNELVRQGKVNEVAYLEHTEKTGRPVHVHSAYFEYLGDAGVIGFILTLLMLFYPLYVALKKRKQSILAWKFVMMHSVAFGVASLTEVPFIRNNWTSTFLVLGPVFFIWLIKETDQQQAAEQT